MIKIILRSIALYLASIIIVRYLFFDILALLSYIALTSVDLILRTFCYLIYMPHNFLPLFIELTSRYLKFMILVSSFIFIIYGVYYVYNSIPKAWDNLDLLYESDKNCIYCGKYYPNEYVCSCKKPFPLGFGNFLLSKIVMGIKIGLVIGFAFGFLSFLLQITK